MVFFTFRPNLGRLLLLSTSYAVTAVIGLLILRPSRQQGAHSAHDSEPYRLFGAKTAYDVVRGKTVKEVSIPGCEPKQFWLLSRHGARYPGPYEMAALVKRLPILRDAIVSNAKQDNSKLGKGTIDRLQNWRQQFNMTLDGKLTPLGQREVHELALRFKQRFPTLLGQTFSGEIYNFRHTDSDRTADSARQFACGLFGDDENVKLPAPLKDDPLIKFYKTCKKWKEEVDDNSKSRAEQERFRQGKEMQRVIKNVSERLGFRKPLSFEDVHLMFTMCRFENGYRSGYSSPWCSVFTKEEFTVIEYDEDLDYYWTDGYGFPINYEQACPPIKDFLDHFRAVMRNDSTAPLGIFRFAHSGLLLKVYARMGLFRDSDPPRADNFKQQFDRKWRSSLIDPFMANMAMVLFKCGEEYKIVTYIQEREVILPGCESVLCPMRQVLDRYAKMADSCDVSEICNGDYYGRRGKRQCSFPNFPALE